MTAADNPGARTRLLGRERECERLDRVLANARSGRAGCVLLAGEPGIGKTALLEYAAEQAAGMRVLRARGAEWEADVAYAGLLELLRPVADRTAELPPAHAAALGVALALDPAAAGERVAVAAGVLGLVARLAEDEPLLVLVDDVHWLDHASRHALFFAARRLRADRVALLFAAREGEGRTLDLDGVERIVVQGLTQEAALALLADRVRGLDTAVAERLHELTRGNPLALLELPTTLSREQLRGRASLPQPLPTAASLEAAFAGRARALGEASWHALVIASASASGGLRPLQAALRRFDLGPEALEAAEDAGLVRLGEGRIEFRHPLIRSAIYQAAASSERHAAHRALADALAGDDEDERAWQLAAASVGADEEAAIALTAAGEKSSLRGGQAEAAAAFERAARLSVDRSAHDTRLFQAANAAWLAGFTEKARLLLDELGQVSAHALRADVLSLRGHIEHHVGTAAAAHRLLEEAARLEEAIDPHKAMAMLADAGESALMAWDTQDGLVIARRMQAILSEESSSVDRFLTWTAVGVALMTTGEPEEGLAWLDQAIRLDQEADLLSVDRRYLSFCGVPAWWALRARDGRAVAERALEAARRGGAVAALPDLLWYVSRWELSAGRWPAAEAAALEGLELAREMEHVGKACACLTLLAALEAAKGDTDRCRAYVAEASELTASTRALLRAAYGERALGLLELGTARLSEASQRLQALKDELGDRANAPDLDPVPDLVESYVRQSRLDEARVALDTAPTPFRWFDRALRSRCRGLVADAGDFELHFREALAEHQESEEVFERARTRLCFGERLLRAGRRREGREELRAAAATFEALGASPWADRAEGELGASGHRRRVEPREQAELSSRELQIALKVVQGLSNRDVGAALFLSAKTVEYHLSSVYRKLDIHSRAELVRRFAGQTFPGDSP